MRTGAVVCGVVLGVLSLDCGGTFCDEYPEACAPIGGGNAAGAPATGAGGVGGDAPGGAGTGGEGGQVPVGPFDVTVSLVDYLGDVYPDAPVLVSDAEGEIVDVVDTGATGSITVSVPNNGRVSVFNDDGSTRRAFSAKIVEGVTTLTFQLPAPLPEPTIQVVITATCSTNCNFSRELSVSCRDSEPLVDSTSPYSQSVQNFYGCPGSGLFDAFIVAYNGSGQAIAVTSATGLQKAVEFHSLPAFSSLSLSDTTDLSLQIDGLLPGFTAKRRVVAAYPDRPGFGYSRTVEGEDLSVELSLVEAFFPTAWAELSVTTTPTQSVARRELIESLNGNVSVVFDVGALAIPAVPGTVDLTTPGQPLAPFALGQGPIGDAIQLTLFRDTTTVWSVSLPAASNGEVLLPALPGELADYAFTQVDDLDLAHVDVDELAGYAAWANEPITMPLEQSPFTRTVSVSF